MLLSRWQSPPAAQCRAKRSVESQFGMRPQFPKFVLFCKLRRLQKLAMDVPARSQPSSLQLLREAIPAIRDLEIELGHEGLVPGVNAMDLVVLRLLAAPPRLRRAVVQSLLLDMAENSRRRRQQQVARLFAVANLGEAEFGLAKRSLLLLLLLLHLVLTPIKERSVGCSSSVEPIWATYDVVEGLIEAQSTAERYAGPSEDEVGTENVAPSQWEGAWLRLRSAARAAWPKDGSRPDPAARMPTSLLPAIRDVINALYLDLPHGLRLDVTARAELMRETDEVLETPPPTI